MYRVALPTLFTVLSLSSLPLTACSQEPPAAAPSDEKERLGYSIGYQVGSDFHRQGIDIDAEMLARGVRDALAGKDPALTPDQMRTTLTEVQRKAMETARARHDAEARTNLEAGQAFLAGNADRAGVTTTASGLQYEVISEGSGSRPEPAGQVTVHYRGTLIDGTEFDSSYARNEPATLPLDRVIMGWQEALPLMSEGSKWKLFVPPNLAYGDRGAGEAIPPNATLVFEVELISANAE